MTEHLVIQSKSKFANPRRGFEEALERARAEMVRAGSRGVVFAIGTASHYWRNLVHFLNKRGIPFRLITSFTLKRQGEGEDVNRKKNDFRDAEMAVELWRTGKFMRRGCPRGVC